MYMTMVGDLLSGMKTDATLSVEYVWSHACENGLTSVVRLLLADELVDPAREDNQAILDAVRGNHTDIVRLLLADKRVDRRARDSLPLQIACKFRYIESIELLRSRRTHP